MSDPGLEPAERQRLVRALMTARRTLRTAKAERDPAAEGRAHEAVEAAKRALGERGPVWWTDGAPDLNRHMARTTTYASWFAELATSTDGPKD